MATGQQFTDWSAAYKLFKNKRMDIGGLFDVARQKVLSLLPSNERIVVHLDDTLIRKRGKKISGTSWKRDPLGPPFHTNFVWGQRFVQISASVPQQPGCCQVRAIPIDFHHSPSIKKPTRFSSEEEILNYKNNHSQATLSYQGATRIVELRKKLDDAGHQNKNLCISVDGSYTNHTVLKQLPVNTTLIGRIRKDTKLYSIPEVQPKVGRKKIYGEQLPTPEDIRKSVDYPEIRVEAWATGRIHNFKVKVINNVRWRSAGKKHDLQLMIISPLGYRLNKKSRILYRQPAYLICTDNKLNTTQLLQAYLWRWEIEVNFRDEKTLLGCGQAQVRGAEAVEKAPAFSVAMYSFLHLSSLLANQSRDQSVLPRPKWDPAKANQRLSTTEIMSLFRLQLWSKNIKNNFSGFVNKQHQLRSHNNIADPLMSAAFYVRN